jgi:hypothetical protein
MALRDRERRWEAKVKEFERELRRDLEKDAERESRHARDALKLAQFLASYNDSANDLRADKSADVSFFADRANWRLARQKALEREKEIFEECNRIRSGKDNTEEVRKSVARSLPLARDEIFGYALRWDLVDAAWFSEICRQRTFCFFNRPSTDALCARLGEFLAETVPRERSPAKIADQLKFEPTWLAVSEGPEDSEYLLQILWRWLIYHTLLKLRLA